MRGEGIRVWDDEGNAYMDFLSGLGVNSLGHCHPKVVEAIRAQAGKLMHVSNLYYNLPADEIRQRLVELLDIDEPAAIEEDAVGFQE